MPYWSLDLFCLKFCNVDKAHFCRACVWTCLCLFHNSHFRLLRRSKESQRVKEAFFLPSSQNDSHLRFLSNVANPGVVWLEIVFCSERQTGHFTEIYNSALLQLGCAVHISSVAVKLCAATWEKHISQIFNFQAVHPRCVSSTICSWKT